VMLWRHARVGVGHTMVTIRAEKHDDGTISAQSVFGNLPPAQPAWTSPAGTERNYSNPQGGGDDGTTDYSSFGGGLKRFRVAKQVGGRWANGIMKADEASWIPDSDRDRIRERPEQLDRLLGELSSQEKQALLLDVIEGKREHLRNFPASCSARIAREEAFSDLYALLGEQGLSVADVDAEHRIFEDYVFPELVYDRSKTCCWNSTNDTMFKTIMAVNEEIQNAAGDACVEPEPFLANGGGYDVFANHAPATWKQWRADEVCPQANVVDDTVAEGEATAFCEWNDGQ
jgi:hypothetical protein